MTTEVAGASASYAAEVARLLWPAPWDHPSVGRGRRGSGSTQREAYLFPSERRARLLVPVDLPSSSVMLDRLGSPGSRLARPVRAVLQRSVGTRVFPLLKWPVLTVRSTDPGADSIERHLGEHLGTTVRVGVLLGTRRVNQKPVLQLFGPDGAVLGYAKVGHNPLTAELVRREARALATVASLAPQSFEVPAVLHHGRWAGLEVLVVSPLAVDARQQVDADTRLAASREISRLAGTTTTTLAESAWLARLRVATSDVPDRTSAARLTSSLDILGERHGEQTLVLGGWHGDWGHWNMAMSRGVLQVWDWERYDERVPAGFDTLHFAAQAVRPGERRAARQEAAFLRSVPRLLEGSGVPSELHDLTLTLYLVEIAARYLDSLRHGATPALQRRTTWVLSLLDQQLARTPGTRGRP